MEAYNSLSIFPDVELALKAVGSNADINAVVFSNGTNCMVETSVKSSPDLGLYAAVFSQIVTVEEAKKYKPHPDVYFHLAEKVGIGRSRENMERMWLVSGNPFDIVGCRAVGMQAAWVDRTGNGWTDRLVEGLDGKPTIVVQDLSRIAEIIMGH